MKIYSDEITEADVQHAFTMARIKNHADIHVDGMRTWKPRRHAYGTEFHGYSLNGTRYANDGTGNRAASWTDWGWVITHLYNVDENARISFYDNEADFVKKVRQYQPRGSSLAFLGALRNINQYGGTNG